MKKNQLAEIKKQSVSSLRETLNKLKTEIVDLKLSKSVTKATNLKQIKNKRHDLAQVLTIIKQKEILEKLTPIESEMEVKDGQTVKA